MRKLKLKPVNFGKTQPKTSEKLSIMVIIYTSAMLFLSCVVQNESDLTNCQNTNLKTYYMISFMLDAMQNMSLAFKIDSICELSLQCGEINTVII